MGLGTYFIGLLMSGTVALFLWALMKLVAPRVSRWPLASAAVRAFPFAFAFAPSLLMKRGLGVLIPASVYLFPQLAVLPFQKRPLDADDWNNLRVAAISFILVWGIAGLILFFRKMVISQKAIHDGN